jgi:predicted TIM-barrel fold metal-dependent hydrolase
MTSYRFNSADNHIDQRWIPARLWHDRVAAKFRENAPKVVEDDGAWVWVWEGKVFGGRDGGAADSPDNRKILNKYYGEHAKNLPDGALPPADAELILKHMDMAGIWAYVGYAAVRKWEVKDVALRHEIHRVYNDWMMEMNGVHPDRLLMLPIMPVFDPDAALAELERMKKLGCKAVEFPVADMSKEIWEDCWEPFWSACEDGNVTVCSHIGDRAGAPYPQTDHGVRMAYFSCVPFSAAKPISQLAYSGTLMRHPKLKYTYGECRAGWAPMLLYWMDRQAEERPGLFKETGLKERPSDYVRRQVTITFEEDYVAGMLLQHPGSGLADILMWGADYPHEQGIWPNVDPVIDRIFEGIDPAIRRRIVFDRCLEMFGLTGPEPSQMAA